MTWRSPLRGLRKPPPYEFIVLKSININQDFLCIDMNGVKTDSPNDVTEGRLIRLTENAWNYGS